MSGSLVTGATELELSDDMIRELREGRMFGLVQAEKEQALAAKAGGERLNMKHGQMAFQIHPQFYHYWGQRLGYECWDNEEFVREFLRDNPECRVRNRSRNVSVGYTPTKSRFHMKFPSK